MARCYADENSNFGDVTFAKGHVYCSKDKSDVEPACMPALCLLFNNPADRLTRPGQTRPDLRLDQTPYKQTARYIQYVKGCDHSHFTRLNAGRSILGARCRVSVAMLSLGGDLPSLSHSTDATCCYPTASPSSRGTIFLHISSSLLSGVFDT